MWSRKTSVSVASMTRAEKRTVSVPAVNEWGEISACTILSHFTINSTDR